MSNRRDSLLLTSVPEFNGTNIPLRRFLRHARKAIDGANDVPTMYDGIISKIKGEARERVQKSSKDFDSMVADLKEAFGSEDDSKHWQERLILVAQELEQSVADYGREVQWIRSNIVEIIRDEHKEELHCGMIRMIEEMSKCSFLLGLEENLGDRDAMAMKFENLKQAIDCADAEVAKMLEEILSPAVTIASAGVEEAELLQEGPPSLVSISSSDSILRSERDLLLLISVPEFDGTNIPLRRFLRHARKAIDRADDVPTMYDGIISKIKGEARERVQESSTDFDSMVADLKAAFGSEDDLKHWQHRLFLVEQEPEQSVADYGREVQWIRSNMIEIIRDEHKEELHCGMIRMIEELSTRVFLMGLSDDLRDRDAMKMKYESLEQAIDCAGAEVEKLLDEGPPPVVTIAFAGKDIYSSRRNEFAPGTTSLNQ